MISCLPLLFNLICNQVLLILPPEQFPDLCFSLYLFSKNKLGEGNGNPLQYSCLEKSHGRRSLIGCSPWGCQESDTTQRLHFHFSLSCIGEENGNPPQCSCLENPRDWGSWWAVVSGVALSRTRLKQLSSSSSKNKPNEIFTASNLKTWNVQLGDNS